MRPGIARLMKTRSLQPPVIGLALQRIVENLVRLSQLNEVALVQLSFRGRTIGEKVGMAPLRLPAEGPSDFFSARVGRDPQQVVMIAHVRYG